MSKLFESGMRKSLMGVLGGFIILFLLTPQCSAQSLERQSLSSMGVSMYSDGIILRQTVGQPSNTFLFLGNEGTLRQGFQQPFSIFNDVDGPEHLEFIVFPNPTFGRITISMAESIETYSIRIESIMGSLVKEISNQTSTVNDVDLNGLMPGIYLLTIQSGQRLGTSRVVLTR